jgi:hypothetical protein
MVYCTHCGASLEDAHQYCWKCGTQAESFTRLPAKLNFRPAAQRRFGQVFGLDPRVAFLTLIVDMMLNAGDLATMGLLLPVSIGAGIVLGIIVYRAQINWYGDDRESARIKALVLGLLTAIPTPLPELLYIPAGLLGLFHVWRRKAGSILKRDTA